MTLRRLLALTGGAVVLAAFTGPHIVPLYDGVGFPDEPYRYAGKTPSPTSINQSIIISDLDQYGAAASSQEIGPQVSVYFQQHSVKLPSGASFTIQASPSVPSNQPQPGSIAGNMYTFTADSKSGTPQFDSSKSSIFLRLPSDKPMYKVAIEYRSGSSKQWQPQFTTKTGNDIFKTNFFGAGQYALATGIDMPSKASPQNGSTWLGPWLRFLPWIIFFGFIVAVILAIRFKRPKSHPHKHD